MVMGGGSGGGDVAAGGLAKFTEGETYPNPKPIPNHVKIGTTYY